MVTVKLDKHLVENYKAIKILREIGFTDEEIQKMLDRQAELDAMNERK